MLENIHIRNTRLCHSTETVVLPKELEVSLLPSCTRKIFTSDKVVFLLQERMGKAGSIMSLSAYASQNTDVIIDIDLHDGLLMLAMENGIVFSHSDGPWNIFHEYHYNIAFHQRHNWKMALQKDTLHAIVMLQYPLSQLKEYSEWYPLEPLFNDAYCDYFLCPAPRVASRAMLQDIELLLKKEYTEPPHRYQALYYANSQRILVDALDTLNSPAPLSQKVLKKQQDFTTIYKIRKSISLRPEKRPGLPELARQAGWNKDKLVKGFRQVYNMSIMEYFHQVQMEYALKLIESTDLSIKEISSSLGLLNQNFTRYFKQYYGKTPMYFRNYKNNNHSN